MPRQPTHTYPPHLPDPRRGYLLAAHIAALWSAVDRERRPDARPIAPVTVTDAVRKSRAGGRYADRPVPPPTGYIGGDPDTRRGALPYWAPADGQTLAQVEAELVAWRRGMVGQGVGGGRKPNTARSAR